MIEWLKELRKEFGNVNEAGNTVDRIIAELERRTVAVGKAADLYDGDLIKGMSWDSTIRVILEGE